MYSLYYRWKNPRVCSKYSHWYFTFYWFEAWQKLVRSRSNCSDWTNFAWGRTQIMRIYSFRSRSVAIELIWSRRRVHPEYRDLAVIAVWRLSLIFSFTLLYQPYHKMSQWLFLPPFLVLKTICLKVGQRFYYSLEYCSVLNADAKRVLLRCKGFLINLIWKTKLIETIFKVYFKLTLQSPQTKTRIVDSLDLELMDSSKIYPAL